MTTNHFLPTDGLVVIHGNGELRIDLKEFRQGRGEVARPGVLGPVILTNDQEVPSDISGTNTCDVQNGEDKHQVLSAVSGLQFAVPDHP